MHDLQIDIFFFFFNAFIFPTIEKMWYGMYAISVCRMMGGILAGPLDMILPISENPQEYPLNGDIYAESVKMTPYCDFQRTLLIFLDTHTQQYTCTKPNDGVTPHRKNMVVSLSPSFRQFRISESSSGEG